MRKLILTVTGLLALAGGSYFLSVAGAAPKDAADEAPDKVGLIDVNYVFQNYEKLKHLQEELRAEAKEEQAKLNLKAKKIQDLQEEMRELTEGSPEYQARDTKLTKLAAEVDTDNKMLTRQFQQKQAKVIHQVYLEVHDVVKQFCDVHKFTVVIRFARTEMSSTDPNKVNQLLAQPVVYHRKRDDLSQPVLDHLNKMYLRSAGGEAKPVSEAKRPKKDNQLKPASGSRD